MYDIVIHAGADYALTFYMRDAENNLIDLTGADIQAQLKPFAESMDSIPFEVQQNGAGGRIQLTIASNVTERIHWDTGVYDVFIYYPDGTCKKVLYGAAKIVPAITRPVPVSPIHTRLVIVRDESALPQYGEAERIYFCYDPGTIYLWNGLYFERQIHPGEIIRVEGKKLIMPAGLIGVN